MSSKEYVKNNKASGENRVTAEMLKASGEIGDNIMKQKQSII